MLLSELRFASLLAYSPRGDSEAAVHSRLSRDALKGDVADARTGVSFAVRMARYLSSRPDLGELMAFLGRDVCLVPVPKSTPIKPGMLWVPERLAVAMQQAGLGNEVVALLRRAHRVPKAATSAASERPLPEIHATSLVVDAQLLHSSRLLLIDDVVTRGATLLGAASKLHEAYPETQIAAFTAMRTISDPAAFHEVLAPAVGLIQLRPQGDTLRRP
jgi:hypothetical protein